MSLRRQPLILTLFAVALFAPVSLAQSPTTESPRVAAFDSLRTMALDDMTMAYREAGQGAPLVLLHGFGSCAAQSWTPFVDTLAMHYRVIAPDLRGHGRSTNPAGTFNHRQSATDVLALLDSLGVGRFRALGISTGGMTLLHAATRIPERLEAMVLIGAATHFPDQARAELRAVNPGNLDSGLEWMQDCATRGPEQVHQLATQFHDFSNNYSDMTFSARDLGTISARTLVVHGDRDNFFPLDIPLSMYEGIPQSQLWIIPGGGHVPIYGSLVPFTSRVLALLSEVPVSPAY